MNKINKTWLITSIICLAPIVLGIVLYDRLPGTIPIQWNSQGNVSNYTSRELAAFGLPCILFGLNLIIHITLNNDPKKRNSPTALKFLGFWVCPVISIIFIPISLFSAIGYTIDVVLIAPMILGIILIICGNYMPKSKQNYTIGIKLPWTLNSAENWNKTHHFAGYVWIICGVAMIVNGILKLWFLGIILIAIMVILPCVYSFYLYKKGI